jgi:hypothetical protein
MCLAPRAGLHDTNEFNALDRSAIVSLASVPFKNRPRSAQDSYRSNHQQPEWKHPQTRNRLQSQSRQQQPLPAQHYEQQQRCSKIHHPRYRRQRSSESADRIRDACDGEGKSKPFFGKFNRCVDRLFAWFHRRCGHLDLVNCDRQFVCSARQERGEERHRTIANATSRATLQNPRRFEPIDRSL